MHLFLLHIFVLVLVVVWGFLNKFPAPKAEALNMEVEMLLLLYLWRTS